MLEFCSVSHNELSTLSFPSILFLCLYCTLEWKKSYIYSRKVIYQGAQTETFLPWNQLQVYLAIKLGQYPPSNNLSNASASSVELRVFSMSSFTFDVVNANMNLAQLPA